MNPWEIIDHTADVALRATGETMAEAFALAAQGMFNLITPSPKAEVGEFDLELEADDHGMLLVDFLTELLFLFDTQRVVFSRCEVKIDGLKLKAKCYGEEFDPEKHDMDMEIKAVTYHMLEVEDGMVQVLFDI